MRTIFVQFPERAASSAVHRQLRLNAAGSFQLKGATRVPRPPEVACWLVEDDNAFSRGASEGFWSILAHLAADVFFSGRPYEMLDNGPDSSHDDSYWLSGRGPSWARPPLEPWQAACDWSRFFELATFPTVMQVGR
jgi:hypothetical protein